MSATVLFTASCNGMTRLISDTPAATAEAGSPTAPPARHPTGSATATAHRRPHEARHRARGVVDRISPRPRLRSRPVLVDLVRQVQGQHLELVVVDPPLDRRRPQPTRPGDHGHRDLLRRLHRDLRRHRRAGPHQHETAARSAPRCARSGCRRPTGSPANTATPCGSPAVSCPNRNPSTFSRSSTASTTRSHQLSANARNRSPNTDRNFGVAN
jgi:hypothetical protein